MLRAGQTLGAYRIEALLGRGAMGVVYRGVGGDHDEPVAIKTLRTELLVGPERRSILARFHQEADIGRRLRHPRIVRVREYGEQDETLYLVMDLIPGQELGRLLEQRPELPLGMSLAILLQILNALAYAHGQGVIHRDIKPANILVRQDYTLVLTDFGIAHVGGSELTQTGDLLGSPTYMAPEQLRGEPLDGRADLFAAGVVLYFLLTGQKPFTADSLATLMQCVLCEDPPPPSAVRRALPAVFDPILRRALAKDREQRFANAREFAAALRQARSAMHEATVVASGRRFPRSILPPAASDGERTVVLAGQQRVERLTNLVRECLTERTTGRRLQEIQDNLVAWFAEAESSVPPASASHSSEARRLRAVFEGELLAALVELIRRAAPAPGRVLRDARGDWLEQVRLFVVLRNAGHRLDAGPAADLGRAVLIQELSGGFLAYANTLNRLLFDDDSPQLLRISADFMRLDLLQLALEELGAAVEGCGVRQMLLLFANQVMGKVNTLIRQFLDRRDPLARFGVASLLVEIEELIVLVERLLEGGEPATVEATHPGGVVVTEFFGNLRRLGRMIGRELVQQIRHEAHPAEAGAPALEQGRQLFVGRLRQLGLLYRLTTHLEAAAPAVRLQDAVAEMHRFLNHLTDRLLADAGAPTDPVMVEWSWERLSVIAELAEQFGWLELRRRILQAVRGRVLSV